MDVGSCESCQARRDLRWEVPYRQSLHARALERESRWREKAEKSEKEARALTAALFTILQTLRVNQINPQPWLPAYFQACAQSGGHLPENIEEFLPWNLPEPRKSQWQCTERPP